ncbi:MAG: polysaccharide biosynthesis/export family protein [Bacteroidales bacterium]|nr:polysaccharide biosynthesis/export family protein [Bacteroidales bacterium]
MLKTLFKLLLIAAMAVGAASCGNKTYRNIAYFQDVEEEEDMSLPMAVNRGIVIQPQDKISIVVSARDPELASMFNLVRSANTISGEGGSTGGSNSLLGYVVDNNGNINMAGLGQIHVTGMNRWELSNYVRNELINREYLKDPIVTVEFLNFKVSVLGEVKSPGTYSIVGDKVTILQALSLAGDLSIMGKRDKIMVLREEGTERSFYHLDIRDTEIFDSPAYYLQQNDVIYVYPNKIRASQSTLNENSFRSFSFWRSVPSTLISLATSGMILWAMYKGDYFNTNK